MGELEACDCAAGAGCRERERRAGAIWVGVKLALESPETTATGAGRLEEAEELGSEGCGGWRMAPWGADMRRMARGL